jgi:hypothetical protein
VQSDVEIIGESNRVDPFGITKRLFGDEGPCIYSQPDSNTSGKPRLSDEETSENGLNRCTQLGVDQERDPSRMVAGSEISIQFPQKEAENMAWMSPRDILDEAFPPSWCPM